MKGIKIELSGIAIILLGIAVTTNNFWGYVLGVLGFGVAVVGCFLKDKHWITSSLSRSCQVRCQIDEDAEPTMRKRGSIFRTLSIGIGYQAQTVVRTQIDRYYSQ